jgi:replicative DNA helicase
MQWDKFNFSDDFQDAILACAVRHPDEYHPYLECLKPRFFNGSCAYDTCHEIQELSTKYGQVPKFTTIGNALHTRYASRNPDRAKECVDYIKKLAKLETGDHLIIRDMVRTFAKERAVQNALKLVLDAQQNGKEIEGGVVKLFEAAMNVGADVDDVGIWLHTDIEKVRTILDNEEYGVKTGYECLDGIWRSGWGPGWLIVPLAPPKRYKSTFCLNLILQMAGPSIRADVFYYACEISQELAMLRGLLNVSRKKDLERFEEPEKFWGDLGEIVEDKVKGNIMFKGFPSKTTTIAQIKAHAKNVISKTGVKPRAIVIDYAETVAPSETTTKGTSDWRQQAQIYTEARAMGHELGCCIIMPDRCNAEAVDKKVPSMRSFQGAFEKAGIVDAAIGLCATESEHKQGRCRYFIFINRHGPQYLHFEGTVDPESYRMTIDREIEYDPDAEEQEAKERAEARRSRGRGPGKRSNVSSLDEED